jgi:hypothetical protein
MQITNSSLNVLSISSGTAKGRIISQRELAELKETDEAIDLAAQESERKRWAIQEAIENGAVVEPGPLSATIKTSRTVIFHSSKKSA